DHQAIFVEFVVGDRDQALVTAAIVPAQHAPRRALGTEHAEDAFLIGGDVVLIVLLAAVELVEEAARRHLLAIADYHGLLAAQQRAERVHRRNLTGLVEYHQVELDPATWQIGRDRHRTHTEHGLYCPNLPPRLLHEPPNRQVTPFLIDFAAHDGQLARALDALQRLPVLEHQAPASVLEKRRVELLEGLDGMLMAGAVETLQRRPGAIGDVELAFVPSPLKGHEVIGTGIAPRRGERDARNQPRLLQLIGKQIELGHALERFGLRLPDL